MNLSNCATKLAISGYLVSVLLATFAAAALICLQFSGPSAGLPIPKLEHLIAHYHQSQLVASLKGSMYPYVADDDDIVIIENWINAGAADNDVFSQQVMPILEYDCQSCHSPNSTKTGAAPKLPLSNYADVTAFTTAGYSWHRLAKSAHIHLFGIALVILPLTLLVAQLKLHAKVKYSLIALAWSALWLDIVSWWLSKYSVIFVYSIIVAGTIELTLVSLMCFICLYSLWFCANKQDDNQTRSC
ncbi:hypothetical protein [Motilimonas eburnea]|uniref:hypothetical protein n=1 Tax=Motilimonas eburnea TaxID=1737488 RepID=UPI001E510812|nr:hypothetical protein [Motilimonas eburnea]MCE2572575.1 hypothetical protein [Motilimonas eburnea]